jgi:hypothetical protein
MYACNICANFNFKDENLNLDRWIKNENIYMHLYTYIKVTKKCEIK